jgi:hypothetical protein
VPQQFPVGVTLTHRLANAFQPLKTGHHIQLFPFSGSALQPSQGNNCIQQSISARNKFHGKARSWNMKLRAKSTVT